MALFNYANREITAKIVYYGPGVCGKTTSLQYIHERIAPAQRGRLLSLATETDRTIFFDLLPLKLGEIGGFKLRFQLYTVPGQVKYNKTRKLVLQGADAVVFVADSQVSRREANIQSYNNLQENLQEQNRSLEELPIVYEFNKRDMDTILSIEDLNADVNPKGLPYFATIATKGVGVMETLEAISKTALQDMEQRLTSGGGTQEVDEDEEELLQMMDEDSEGLMDLTAGEAELSFSTDELDSLELESDFESTEDSLESKPIGYEDGIVIEELEINDEDIAHTGTLQESEFFNLKEIEEQALRELDDFLESTDVPDTNAGFSDVESADGEDAFEFSLGDEPTSPPSLDTGFEVASSETANEEEALLDFSLDEGNESSAEEPGLSFSLDEENAGTEDEEGLSFDMEAPEEENLSFSGLSLGEEEDVSAKGDIESLDIADSDLDFSFEDDDEEEGADELPAFNLDEVNEEDDSSSEIAPGEDDELVSFGVDDESLNLSASEEIGSLNFGESDFDLSSGSDEADDEFSGDDTSFRITDSVRFEMQVGEDISTVTPFEQQLEELSEEGFSGEEGKAEDEFQPEISEGSEEEAFQTISDEWTRLIVLAKYFYHRGEQFRAQHTVGENVLAVNMYYTSVESALKAVASKYESCNPKLASFHLTLQSIEEETGREIAGSKSLMNNIVNLKHRIQLEAQYPDDEECELAARISERFLSTLADDFLTIDFSKLSPVLPRGEEA